MLLDLQLFIQIAKTYTDDNDAALHPAKALKWTSERLAGDGHGMNKHSRDMLWQKVIDMGLVRMDKRGNIIGLSGAGESMLLEVVKEISK